MGQGESHALSARDPGSRPRRRGALYLGDDVTDEDAFETLAERGVGIFVGSPDDPEVAGRTTAADYILHSTEEVRQFLDTLAR